MTNHGLDAARDRDLHLVPLDALCDQLVAGPHAGARAAILALRDLGAPVELGDDATARIRAALEDLDTLLDAHLRKAEHLVFPAVSALADAERRGGGRPPSAFSTLLHPIRVLEAEHVQLGGALRRLDRSIAAVTGDLRTTSWWTAMRRAADDLAAALSHEVRIESLVLFPRALDLDRRL